VKRFFNCRAYAFEPVTRRYRRVEEFVVAGASLRAVGTSLGEVTLENVDLQGATVVPAFADCHVHLTDTGLTQGARDLSDVRDAASFAARVAALPDEPFVFASNYDESRWDDDGIASAHVLERNFPDRYAMLVRVDGHSSLVNKRAFAYLGLTPATEGVERDAASGEPTGRLFSNANWSAQARFWAEILPAQRRAADRAALDLALSNGVATLHVQLTGFQSGDEYAAELEALRALGPAVWHPKICDRDATLAVRFGLPHIGGDVFLDGSLGSGTAALSAPYCDRQGRGQLTLDDAAVFEYFASAEAHGISAGVHAIGDAAIEQALTAWERVLPDGPSRRARHFIEHFELASPQQIERAARLGLFLSMQPQFDAYWGGPDGMYERRLGIERTRSMNAFRTAANAGATLCGGSDSPVCTLEPLAGMAAACEHHVAEQRLEPLEALTMYTYDAARLAFTEATTGRLAPGYSADFVVLDHDPFEDGAFARTRVLATWLRGEQVYAAG
jgi:predicted amidohydrolase YtcJ